MGCIADLGQRQSEKIFQVGLDWANQIELLQQIRFCAQALGPGPSGKTEGKEAARSLRRKDGTSAASSICAVSANRFAYRESRDCVAVVCPCQWTLRLLVPIRNARYVTSTTHTGYLA
jgi:hypothetical protein